MDGPVSAEPAAEEEARSREEESVGEGAWPDTGPAVPMVGLAGADTISPGDTVPVQPSEDVPGEEKTPATGTVDGRLDEEEDLAVIAEDVDEEILEIFLEEADEELEVIRAHLPRWKNAPDEDEPLQIIRRSFHTLKGSARLVGAMWMGEFAWSFEDLLNRVIEGKVAASPVMFDLLEQAASVGLPQLIAQLRDGTRTEAIVGELMEMARAVSRSEEPLLPAAATGAQSGDTAGSDESMVEAEPEPMMDPVLYDIFSKETSGHLEVLRGFIQNCRKQPGGCSMDEDAVRALHTLHGSARMAEVDVIAGLAGALEKYIKTLLQAGEPLKSDGLFAITESVSAIEEAMAAIGAGTELPDTQPLVDRVNALLTQVEQRAVEEEQEQDQRPATVSGAAVDAEGAVDPELLEIFLEEAAEILDNSELALQRWRNAPDDRNALVELQRDLHTLKGGARMAGVAPVGDLSHALESLLTGVVDGQVEISEALFDRLHGALDRLLAMQDQLRATNTVEPARDLIAQLEQVRSIGLESGQAETPLAGEMVDEVREPATGDSLPVTDEPLPVVEETVPVSVPEEDQTVRSAAEDEDHEPAEPPEARPEVVTDAVPEPVPEEPRAAAGLRQDVVRVRGALLNDLVNYAGEVSIYRSRLEQQVNAIQFNLVEMDQTVRRLRDQLRKLEGETEAQILYRFDKDSDGKHADFDPLEMDRFSLLQQLSRALAESVDDLTNIQSLLDNQSRETETLLLQQARVTTDLQEGLMRTRMVPFSTLEARLGRIVRQTCAETGKKADLVMRGADNEIDRNILEHMTAPLEHMMRNAVSHGIEAPGDRVRVGKPDTGVITVSLERRGPEIILRVQDDGAGINTARIRQKAEEKGLIDPDAEMTDREIMQYMLESGISTADKVTQISGRGVGMDVVNSEIKQLGGTMEIASRYGQGVTFTVHLPFTLAVNRALLVNVAEEVYAIPLASMDGVVRMGRDELERSYNAEHPLYEYAGSTYHVRHLGTLLGASLPQLPEKDQTRPVLLVRAGDRRLALQVDSLVGSREVVVKSLGPQLSNVPGVAGATILSDGRVVLILELGALARLGSESHISRVWEAVEEEDGVAGGPATVMVVDDSITMRKVATRLLERHGMQVVTAKDGIDALAQLQDHHPDVMLLDIEMPRMDGFELTGHLRKDKRFKKLPIIMITSRTGQKHRDRAEELGVTRYLGKPYHESELLENIQAVLNDYYGGV